MFCGKCGTQVQDGATFCPNCGEKLGVNPINNTGNTDTNTKQNKKRMKKLVSIICLLLVVIIGVGVFSWFYFNNKPEFYLSRKTEIQNTSRYYDDEYDENENRITDTWYLEDGQISKTVVSESDSDVTTIFSFDEDNHVSGVELTYGNESYNFEVYYSKQNNQYVGDSDSVNIDGDYIGYRFVYDEQNRLISKVVLYNGYELSVENNSYFSNGKVKLKETKQGYIHLDNTFSYSIEYIDEYDEFGRTIRNTVYSNNRDYWYEWLYEYDGNILKSFNNIYSEGYGNGMNSYATLENRDGNCYEYYERDENGDVDGSLKYTYDDNEKLIKIESFTADKGLNSYTEYSYDDYGNCIEQKQYDRNGYLIYQTTSVYSEKQ